MGFNNVQEFCDRLPSQIRILKGNGYHFFGVISDLLAGTGKSYAYFSLNVTEIIRPDAVHI